LENTYDEWSGTYNILIFQKAQVSAQGNETAKDVKEDKPKDRISDFQTPKSVMGDFDLAQQKIIKEKMKAKTEANRAAKLENTSKSPSRPSTLPRKSGTIPTSSRKAFTAELNRKPSQELEEDGIENYNGDHLTRILMAANNGFDDDANKAKSEVTVVNPPSSSSKSGVKLLARSVSVSNPSTTIGTTRASAAQKPPTQVSVSTSGSTKGKSMNSSVSNTVIRSESHSLTKIVHQPFPRSLPLKYLKDWKPV
jgi:hypothetical protein